SESCPKKEAEEVEQEENEINEVSSVSAKTKRSQSVRDESSEDPMSHNSGSFHSNISSTSEAEAIAVVTEDKSSKSTTKGYTTEVSYCTNAEEISEDEKAEKKNAEEAENEAADEVEKETAEVTAVDEGTEECVNQEQIAETLSEAAKADQAECSRDCNLLAQKTVELKSDGQVENVETVTEQMEAEEQSKQEEHSSRPSTACSKSKGEKKARSTREDSVTQKAEENKEDQCSNCENGQEERGENENEENIKLLENGEQEVLVEEVEAVNKALPKENIEEAADQLATNIGANVSDADCGTNLKDDLDDHLGKESVKDPESKVNIATKDEACSAEGENSEDGDKYEENDEKREENGNSKSSKRDRGKKTRKKLKTLSKAVVFFRFSSVGKFSQQSQKGSDDESEEECKDMKSISDHPNGEVQSDESSKPSKMYPDSEDEEEDKASSCTDPLGDEKQADAEGADPKEDEHTDEVQAIKKKEDSDEIDQDDLD
ncbi:hypothetical protein Anapl_16236, partial [Anas platyrhynchos]